MLPKGITTLKKYKPFLSSDFINIYHNALPGPAKTEEEHSLSNFLVSKGPSFKCTLRQDFFKCNLFTQCLNQSLRNMWRLLNQATFSRKTAATIILLYETEHSPNKLAL